MIFAQDNCYVVSNISMTNPPVCKTQFSFVPKKYCMGHIFLSFSLFVPVQALWALITHPALRLPFRQWMVFRLAWRGSRSSWRGQKMPTALIDCTNIHIQVRTTTSEGPVHLFWRRIYFLHNKTNSAKWCRLGCVFLLHFYVQGSSFGAHATTHIMGSLKDRYH